MGKTLFDPYEDRTARNIRNRISTALIRALESGDSERLEAAARQICPPASGRIYCDFVRGRLVRYRRVLEKIRTVRAAGPLQQAVLLWNEGLFFEVHEILESVWNNAQRWRKEALRGFIQAAGVYIHRKRGADRAAAKLAARAAAHLGTHRKDLAEIANVEDLIEALSVPDESAPELRWIG